MNIQRYKLEQGDFVLTDTPRFKKGNDLSRKLTADFSQHDPAKGNAPAGVLFVWYYTISNAAEEIIALYTQMDIYDVHDFTKITNEEIKESLLKSWQTVERHFDNKCKENDIEVKDTPPSEEEIQKIVEKLYKS